MALCLFFAMDAPAVDQPSAQGGGPAHLEVNGDDALRAFLEKVAKTGDGHGRTRILHFGDSHVSVAFTKALGNAFKKAYGDAGPGFLSPSIFKKGHGALGIEIVSEGLGYHTLLLNKSKKKKDTGPFGVAGRSSVVNEPEGRITIDVVDRCQIVEVFYLEHPQGGKLELSLDGKLRKTVMTIGKDLRVRRVVEHLEGGFNSVGLEADEGTLMFGVVLERSEHGVVYDSLGINGARIVDLHNNVINEDNPEIPEAFSTTYGWRDPDLFILSFGTNSATDKYFKADAYGQKLGTIVDRLKTSAGEDVACLLMGPPDRNVKKGKGVWVTPNQLRVIIDIQRKVAAEKGCVFFDTFEYMGGTGSIHAWTTLKEPLARNDHVHLTSRGYKKVALEVFDSLEEERKRLLGE